jgi:hypothetical protein
MKKGAVSSMKERAVSRGGQDHGWSGVPGRATAGARAEAFQSSIRARWAGPSVLRCSGAQSRWRPSVAESGEKRPLTTRELARAAARRRAAQHMSAGADHELTAVASKTSTGGSPRGGRARKAWRRPDHVWSGMEQHAGAEQSSAPPAAPRLHLQPKERRETPAVVDESVRPLTSTMPWCGRRLAPRQPVGDHWLLMLQARRKVARHQVAGR